MTTGRDDDALSWDGDDDPTLDVGSSRSPDAEPAPTPAPAPALPDGFTAVGRGSEAVGATRDPEDSEPGDSSAPLETEGERRPMSSAALVGIGILAGVYLLLSIGWLLGAARFQLVAALFLEPVAFQITLWLAVLALPLWFVTVLWLTRGGRTAVRFALLVAGALVLIPWPFVLAGAAL